ncbi:MAG: HEPN domain-containing protein [Halobacteria archaeon]
MAADARARKRFAESFGAAKRWMESAEVGTRAGDPSLAIEASHLAVHNAAVAYRSLKHGRRGRLRHGEVGKRAAEAGMPEELAQAIDFIEELHAPISYGGGAPPSESQAEQAIRNARKVLAFVKEEAERAGFR